MRAAVLEEMGKPLRLHHDVQLQDPEAGEVIVRVAACGLCHSDLSAIDGLFPVPTPIVLGHEAAGIVEEIGPGVRSLEVGDHVVLTPVPACGRCYACVRGQPGACVNTQAVYTFAMPDGSTRLSREGAPVHRGLGVAAFADRVVALEHAAVRIPREVPMDVACVVGCGVQTGVGAVLNTAEVEEGATVLVIGLGGVGLSVVQGARLAAASRIIASDPVGDRRRAALELGATEVLDPSSTDVVETVFDLTGGIGADYAFEVAGSTELLRTCLDATRAGGTTVMVGAPPLEESIEIPHAVVFGSGEKRLLGCLLGSSNSLRDIPRLVALWQVGRLDLDALVTRRRPLEEINDAVDELRAHAGVRTVLTY